MQRSILAKQVSRLLLLAVIVFYFYGLGHLPLVGPDEPRYAQVAREMLMRADLITPTLAGQTWFEKPVLLYWLMMLSYKFLGVTEQAARLGPAAAGVLTLVAVYWLARKVEIASGDEGLSGFGLWSAIVAATTLGIVVFSRAASFDILVTMTMTWALVFFFVQELPPGGTRRTLCLAAFYFFVGLSLLAKGLVGLLPLGVAATYFLFRRQIPQRRLLVSLLWGMALILGVAASWYGPVLRRHGSPFVNEFIIQHHFARYLSNKYNHPQPFFFYLLVLVLLTLPWTPFFLNGIARLPRWLWRGDDAVNRMRVFSFAWLLLPMLFFSFSGSKLPGYIIPVLPAAALLAAERVTRFVTTATVGKGAIRAVAVLGLLFSSGALFYARRFGMVSVRCALSIVLPMILASIFVFVWTRWRTACVILVAGATVTSVIILLNCGVDKVSQRESVKELIQAATVRGYSELPICALHEVERSVEFYGGGRLLYGSDGEPVKFEGSAQVVELVRNNKHAVLVFVPLEHISQLTDLTSVKTEVIADNGVLAMVAVHPW